MLSTKHAIEMLFEGSNNLGDAPITKKIPNIFGHSESDMITVKTKNVMPSSPSAMWDYGEAFYGELDWDDIIGFGHHWRRRFCWVATYNGSGAHLVDCDVKEEGVFNRDTIDKKK
jgi:hypothetical protein